MKKFKILCLLVVIFYLIIGLIKWNMTTIFASLLSILFIVTMDIIAKKLKFNNSLKILIYIFILLAELLGEVYHFYENTWWFDIVMHTYFAFIISFVSSHLLKYFNIKSNYLFIIIFIFSFAMMTESIWEIFEFSMDRLIGSDMQKDTIIREINSTYLSNTIYVNKAIVNDINLTNKFGGYIDIGLYDTITDMICTVVGSLIFIITMKKRLY